MSQVRNVQLEVTQRGNNGWRVEVSYEARFTIIEVRNNIRFRERLTLFGVDQVISSARPQLEELELLTNGVRATSRIQTITRTFNVDEDALDEDNGSQLAGISIPEISNFNNPTDEILAQIDLIPIGINRGRGRSAIVRDNF